MARLVDITAFFPLQFEDGPARLRTFMNQPNNFGVASFVAKCLALFPSIF
jgi:hypothetical protein